jgi:hypothetical protein
MREAVDRDQGNSSRGFPAKQWEETAMELHWFVWLVVGAMTIFAGVLGLTALMTRGE